MKEFWDFNENINFSIIKGYKVLNIYPNLAEAAGVLDELKFITYRSFISIHHSEKITPEIKLLLNTPFRLQEMQLEEIQGRVVFEGLNKPKGIYSKKGSSSIGKDGNLRAAYRVIFLTLRNKNGKINVAVGPCIGVNNYEVGQDFYERFIQESIKNKKIYHEKN